MVNTFINNKNKSKMEKKKSSIDWLIDKLSNYDEEMIFLYKNEIEQAKAMHKYEILETFEKAYLCGYRDNGDGE